MESEVNKEKLVSLINKSIINVVNRWNNVKIKQFSTWFEDSFSNYFKERQTQEKTKSISPIIDKIFSQEMYKMDNTFLVCEGSGVDYKWGDLSIENKLTLSSGNSWTGNGYKKTGYHILAKLNVNDEGFITEYFCCLVNLDDCVSGWSVPSNSNFSSLKLLNDDLDKVHVIHGSISKGRKYLKIHLKKNGEL